jgi:hypothetical protein
VITQGLNGVSGLLRHGRSRVPHGRFGVAPAGAVWSDDRGVPRQGFGEGVPDPTRGRGLVQAEDG